jgi:hypothetical protein
VIYLGIESWDMYRAAINLLSLGQTISFIGIGDSLMPRVPSGSVLIVDPFPADEEPVIGEVYLSWLVNVKAPTCHRLITTERRDDNLSPNVAYTMGHYDLSEMDGFAFRSTIFGKLSSHINPGEYRIDPIKPIWDERAVPH